MTVQSVSIFFIAALAVGITANWFVRAGNASVGGVFGFYRAVFVPGLLSLDILAAFLLLVSGAPPTIWGPALMGMVSGGFIGLTATIYRPIQTP